MTTETAEQLLLVLKNIAAYCETSTSACKSEKVRAMCATAIEETESPTPKSGKQLEEIVGRIFLQEFVSVLNDCGDTTTKRIAVLINLTEIVQLLQDAKLVEVVGRHVRMTAIGRSEL